ncbi:MAG: DUF4258 domain-containing protein [Methanosarcinales archaeon]|uniref:DUF4258 domain-containing protein n=1 Tax=Candidatus Ethanoperedens thermophilum TaxID=2766897 RepID=A0A848D9G7_9EURY|nr:DUF4258 domain-containing protein [Candidatus Ethanoperedens thermophilum]
MRIKYTSHAEIKFDILKRYGINYLKSQIEDVLQNPEKVEDSRKNRKIAQKQVNSKHLIRVVYEEKDNDLVVITFYPARRKRYENKL